MARKPYHDEYYHSLQNTGKLVLASVFLMITGVCAGIMITMNNHKDTEEEDVLGTQIIVQKIIITPTPAPIVNKSFIEWTDYNNGEFKAKIPVNWQNLTEMPGYNLPNSLHLVKWGDRQKRGEDMYDGALFIASNSAKITTSLQDFAKQIAGDKDSYGTENKFIDFVVEEQPFIHVYGEDPRHGMYFTKKDDTAYAFTTFASNDEYRDIVEQIMQSLSFGDKEKKPTLE